MVATRAEAAIVERFTDSYRLCCSPARLDVEGTVLGADYGSTGYTTRAQADRLGRELGLALGVRLADLGAGAGWPGLYLARQTGCQVVGTDLPVDGLARARSRSIEDGVADRASYVVTTGRHQPLRPGAFDAVVHTDVLCCLGPKLAVLRACEQLLRPGGRLAFTTIHVAPGLDSGTHHRAVRAGPPHVATRRPYPELVAQAGFVDVTEIDVTDDYARTQQAWLDGYEAHSEQLRSVISDTDFALGQSERRRTRAAIDDGVLRRSLLTATAP